MELQQLDIVAILGTGVSGFAFLMLLIGFLLTNTVQKRIAEVDLAAFSPEQLAVWEAISGKQLANTRYFIGASLVFFLGGLMLLYVQHRPEASINVTVYPSESGYHPALKAHDRMVVIDENGNGKAALKSEHTLFVNSEKIHKVLAELSKQLSASKASERELSTRLAAKLAGKQAI